MFKFASFITDGLLVTDSNGVDNVYPLEAQPPSDEIWILDVSMVDYVRHGFVSIPGFKSLEFFGDNFFDWAALIDTKQDLAAASARMASRVFSIAARKTGVERDVLFRYCREQHSFHLALLNCFTQNLGYLYLDSDNRDFEKSITFMSRPARKLPAGTIEVVISGCPHQFAKQVLATPIPSGSLREIEFTDAKLLEDWLSDAQLPYLCEVTIERAVTGLLPVLPTGAMSGASFWVAAPELMVLKSFALISVHRCFIADEFIETPMTRFSYTPMDILSVSSSLFAKSLLLASVTTVSAQQETLESKIARSIWLSSSARAYIAVNSIRLAGMGINVTGFKLDEIYAAIPKDQLQTYREALTHHGYRMTPIE